MANSGVCHEAVRLIPARRYWIGDDSTPHAGPQHLVTLNEPVWIDVRPVSVGDVQKCIMQGGLTPMRNSPRAKDSSGKLPHSVDGFFHAVLDATARVYSGRQISSKFLSSYPACGLLWDEAIQVCNFFRARLPTEVEWEIAMGWRSQTSGVKSGHVTGRSAIVSRLGCDCYAGMIQEWTGSGWTSRYWVDIDVNAPQPLAPETQVSVRGCLPTAKVASQYARLAYNRDDVSAPRIFRRAWDHRPETEMQ